MVQAVARVRSSPEICAVAIDARIDGATVAGVVMRVFKLLTGNGRAVSPEPSASTDLAQRSY